MGRGPNLRFSSGHGWFFRGLKKNLPQQTAWSQLTGWPGVVTGSSPSQEVKGWATNGNTYVIIRAWAPALNTEGKQPPSESPLRSGWSGELPGGLSIILLYWPLPSEGGCRCLVLSVSALLPVCAQAIQHHVSPDRLITRSDGFWDESILFLHPSIWMICVRRDILALNLLVLSSFIRLICLKLFFSHCARACKIQFWLVGIEPRGQQQWKCQILTIRPPGLCFVSSLWGVQSWKLEGAP